jgi:hypothetical protein
MLKFLIVIGSLTISTIASSQIRSPNAIFNDADALFAQRENNIQAVTSARSKYLEHSNSSDPVILTYVVQQVGRLAHYEGYFLSAARDKTRKARVYKTCFETANLLAPHQADFRTFYTYWRLSCSSLWLKYAKIGDRLGQLGRIKEEFDLLVGDDLEIKSELNIDTRYMGGGITRVLAGVYGNSLSNLVRSSLPDRPKALEMANRSLAARPFPGTTIWGTDVYRNYTQKVEIYIGLEDQQSADELIEDTVEEIQELEEDGELPVGLEPESIGEIDELLNLHSK